MKTKGTITKILELQKGTSKAGKEWQKQTFIIDTGEQYNNLVAFEIFGEEKISSILKNNKLNDIVEVEFNISCNEWQGKYFTTLQAWKVWTYSNETHKKADQQQQEAKNNNSDDLPF